MSIKGTNREEIRNVTITYDKAIELNDNFLLVKKDEKLGVLDKHGNVILEPIYLTIELVNKNIFVAALHKGAYQIFSERGMLITTLVFTSKRDAIDCAKFFKI